MALAAGTIMAPAAFADSTLEATNEATGAHCPAVTVTDHTVAGGCGPTHVVSTGSVTLRAHIFGIESTDSVCTTEFDSRIDENADGYIYNQHLEGAACSREACEEADGHADPWRKIKRIVSGIVKVARVIVCVADTISMALRPECTIDVPFVQTSHNSEEYGNTGGVEMPGIGTAGFRCELIGHWTVENTPRVEITET